MTQVIQNLLTLKIKSLKLVLEKTFKFFWFKITHYVVLVARERQTDNMRQYSKFEDSYVKWPQELPMWDS